MEAKYILNTKNSPKKIVFLLHGYGSDSNDMLNIVKEHFYDAVQNTLFVSINAPYVSDIGFGYKWFSLLFEPSNVKIKNESELVLINTKLRIFIENTVEKYALPFSQVFIFGFSQGGILALFHGLSHNVSYGGIICHSGCFYDVKNFKFTQTKQNLLLLHGMLDKVISFKQFSSTLNFLDSNNIIYEHFIDNNLEHSCSHDTLLKCSNFITKSN